MGCRFYRTVWLAVTSLVLASTALVHAQTPGTRFEISGYTVEGGPLLRADDFARVVRPFTGSQKNSSDVLQAQQAVQQAYLDAGHCSVRVTLVKPEPDAGIINFKLVATAVPVSKDCLPTVVLDDKQSAPLAIAPGEVAVRPFTDVTQPGGETAPAAEAPTRIARAAVKPLQNPPPSEPPAQIARAPLKPLQDRPPVIAPAEPAQSEVAAAPASPGVAVMSLAEAPSQPGLTLTPAAPIGKPVAPVPPVAVAVAPISPPLKFQPEIAPAPIVAVPVVPVDEAPKQSAPPPQIALAPREEAKPEIAAVKAAPVVSSPAVTPPPNAPVAEAVNPPVASPTVIATAPVRAVPLPEPQTIVPTREQSSAPAIVEKPIETPAPPTVATTPAKPGPFTPEVMPVAPSVTPSLRDEARSVEAAPDIASEPVKPAAVIAATSEAPLASTSPPVAIPQPAKEQAAAIPQRAPVPSVADKIPETPASAPRIAVVEPVKPRVAPSVIAAAPVAAPPAVPASSPKEQVAVAPEMAPAPGASEKPVEKPAPAVIAAAPVKPVEVTPEPVASAKPPALSETPRALEAPKDTVEQATSAPVVAAIPQSAPIPLATTPEPESEPVKQPIAAKPEPAPVPPQASVIAEKPAEKPPVEEVVVRPLTGAVAMTPEPREPVEATPGVERAAVRPLQDRAPASEAAPRVAEAAASPSSAPASSVVVQAPAAPAAQPVPPADASTSAAALKFDIDRYLVEGNTLLKQDAINKVLGTYTGKQKDFADVQRALEALQIAYQTQGWGAVQVTLPEQELERGEVRFEVIETRIGKIDVQGNEHYSQANVRRSVPSLKPGQTPNSLEIARSLKVANENAGKQSQVSLKAGSKDGEVDATIKVVDENPRKYSVSMENSGTASTGQLRLGFGFQNSNLWDRDHQLTFQYITNPDHINKVTVLGLGYHAPLYGSGDSIDFVLGYSDVDSGTVQQLFNVSGAGLIALARYNHNLKRIDDYEHKITFGLDYKAFQNKVTIGGTALVPDITLHPLSIAYSGELKKDENAVNFYASLTYNPFEGGNDAAQSDFRASRGSGGGASAEYVIWRYGLNYQRALPDDWIFRFSANAQTTNNALVAGEQFGLGGASSVRGFNERVYSNDRGHQASMEVYTPDIAGKIGFEGGRLKLLAFYDTGTLRRNFLQVGEQTGLSVDSMGVGLRLTFREKFNLRVDYAQVLHDGGVDAGIRDGRRNSNTLHASAIFVY